MQKLAADLGVSLSYEDPSSSPCVELLSGGGTVAGVSLVNGLVTVYLAGPCNQNAVEHEAAEHFLTATVLPKALALNGHLVLHAGCVELFGSSVLLIGTTGAGKSTLTVSFSLDGYPAWCDDAVLLDLSGPEVSGRPVSRKMRLRRGTQLGLLGSAVDDGSFDPRLTYCCDKTGSSPPPVSAIFVIDAPCDDSAVSVRQLSSADATIAIVANSFAFDPENASEAAQRMKMASDLVRMVPVFDLRYPRQFARLPEVHREIVRVVSSMKTADAA